MSKRSFVALTEEVIVDMRNAIAEASSGSSLGKSVMEILSLTGLDISGIAEGMEGQDKQIFLSCIALLVMGAKDPAQITAITLLLHDYLLPTYEKKKALEQMVQSLANAGITAPDK